MPAFARTHPREDAGQRGKLGTGWAVPRGMRGLRAARRPAFGGLSGIDWRAPRLGGPEGPYVRRAGSV